MADMPEMPEQFPAVPEWPDIVHSKEKLGGYAKSAGAISGGRLDGPTSKKRRRSSVTDSANAGNEQQLSGIPPGNLLTKPRTR